MKRNLQERNNLIIAAVIIAITASFFTIKYFLIKEKIETFNAVLGKDEKPGFNQISKIIMDGNEIGTLEENVNYEKISKQKSVIEIKEKMFLSQVNDVYLNTDDYLGKTIKLEGIFKKEPYKDKLYYFVLRYGPGCCGSDGNVGFEIVWSENKKQPYPEQDSWVEAVGILKDDNEYGFLYLDLISLTVLNRRGAENVRQ